MAKKYALLIANTEYRDGKLASLSHPGLAFGELAEALKDPARGAFNQVETLVNANLSHVLNSLDRFFSRKPADAVLLVYVGGHGFVDAQGELFLALKESDRIRLKSTALMAAVLGMNMDQCPSPHKVLLLDCHYHSPFQDAPAGASLRIDPARIFAGRGLPKVIFSTGESTPGPVAKPPPPTATPVTGKLPIIPRDFTRTLAETLRTPSSAPGSRSAFTVEDWCKEVAIELKASRAEA
ncbi:MAG TPA: caspase family protein, partial [Fibrobacteria bacterium]|nr:caspase family protein [Fibrobacteria bacterium]